MISSKNIGEVYQNIPTYDNGVWTTTSFSSREEFALTLEQEYFKEPGEYEFDETISVFLKERNKFNKLGFYCEFPEGSLDFIDYWDDQKLKSRKGILVYNNGKKWYLPRDYYFWINFLPIVDKVKKKTTFGDLWDTQLHMALYECIGELKYKHGVILKKRQFGSSFYHVAKLINQLWFEEGAILKMGASLSVYLTGVAGSWKMADAYRSFLNQHTAWYRPMNPGGVGSWQQKQEVTEGGKTYNIGTMGILQSLSFEQSDTAGVGGLTTLFFYEEAGIAKSMDKTYEFLRPAMESGTITTGYFIASGSVGDLKQCKPLKEFMYKAEDNGFYAVRNKHSDEKGTVIETGLFIPEQYSMPPYIDEFGNSLVEEATKALLELRKEWEETLSPEIYQLRISQKPMNLKEAFASRDESVFPLALIESHSLSIKDGDYPYELYELSRDVKGKIVPKITNKPPINKFPVEKKLEDKSGSIVVFDTPVENPEWGMYYASVDPVAVGKTTSSLSLCSIIVYQVATEVTRIKYGERKTIIEGDKVVATWCGRFDDLNKTHELLELLIEWYNAWTLVENNVSQFIIHMVAQKKQKYLVPKSQMMFLKELKVNNEVYAEYGWKNVGKMFHENLIPYLVAFIKEVIDEEFDEDGNSIKKVYGITRIPDIMICEEMSQYQPGLNVDRLVSLAALIAFITLQRANTGYKKRVETEDSEYLDKSDKIYKLKSSPFKNIGKQNYNKSYRVDRNPFKRLK